MNGLSSSMKTNCCVLEHTLLTVEEFPITFHVHRDGLSKRKENKYYTLTARANHPKKKISSYLSLAKIPLVSLHWAKEKIKHFLYN